MTCKYNSLKKILYITIQKVIHLNLHLHFKKKGKMGYQFHDQVISPIINLLKIFFDNNHHIA